MDRMYRYQRHIYDLTRKYYLFGRNRMIAGLDAPAGASILEVGCGTGRNLMLARRLYPAAKLYGLDISQEMLQTARAKFAGKADKGTMPTLVVADATAFRAGDFGTDGFDRVMIPYALSMIPGWEQAIAASLATLKPGGSLHIVDFGQQEGLPAWFRSMLQAWLARFHVTPRSNLRMVLEGQSEAARAQMMFEDIGRGYAWHAVIRRPG
ncbi:class I SAM-dependent methyltransferase [Neorhizobium sp. NCHU2750]|uniref:class I SAM-dependent methyltransferase n=1 Tax=Neorhizobium sp. NCHU2750 TaxID=1825976 RepID=UPI000E74F5BD